MGGSFLRPATGGRLGAQQDGALGRDRQCSGSSPIPALSHRPRNILDVTQADHFEIAASAADRTIHMRRLAALS
jgi:hypothetical protein